MALKFGVVCDLLSTLEDVVSRDPPLLQADRRQNLFQETRAWFRAHRRTLDALDPINTVALLSTLLPERRTDRVYGLQNATLAMLLSRTLGFSAARIKDLNLYKYPGNGDLAACVERTLRGGGPPALPVVTVQEIDQVLMSVAAESRFSSQAIKRKIDQRDSSQPSHTIILANIFRRVHPQEAKWLVRLILKDFSPVCLDDGLVLKLTHFLLPDILHFQQDFDVAVNTLRTTLKAYPSCPDPQSEPLLRKLVSSALRPVVGIKVARPTLYKARSIQNCLDMLQQRTWMVERKYDGEYCEMHIDLSRGQDWLKIFSKSGKESTGDRALLKPVLQRCLGIGKEHCKIKSRCILLGEMVVWSDQEQRVLPFHKIRKHVTRSGVEIGTTNDSPRHSYEHLMIVFFDLLILDDVMILNKPIEERKSALNGLYRKKTGRAITAESRVMDFSLIESKRRLIAHLASSIAARHEGLVLKPCGQSYFSMTQQDGHACIKLKKDYIKGLGDEADFAVIGASYQAQDALRRGLKSSYYTRFHLGCLTNQGDVRRFGARPSFKIVGSIGNDHSIPPPVLEQANARIQFSSEPFVQGTMPSTFDLTDTNTPARMDISLREPFVFEVLGSSYDKASSTDFWMLRHARVLKMHQDRSWKDCVSFQELQDLASAAIDQAPDAESQENLHWLARVEQSCRRKIARKCASVSPKSITSGTTRASVSPDKTRTLQDVSPNIMQSPFRVSGMADTDHDVGLVDHRDGSASLPTPPRSSPAEVFERDVFLGVRYLPLSSKQDGPRSPKRAKKQSSPLVESKMDRMQLINHAPVPATPCPIARVSGSAPSTFVVNQVLNASGTHPSKLQTLQRATKPTGEPGLCIFETRSQVMSHSCPLTSCVVYIPSPLSHLDKIAQSHGATVTKDLIYWDRTEDALPPLSETIGESQSFVSLRKVVLVAEQAPLREMMGLVRSLGELNRGRGLRERIEVLSDAGFGESAGCCTEIGLDGKSRIGYLEWDEGVGKSVLRLHG